MRVLVCDDEPSIRLLFRTAFERLGAAVHDAVDGEDCLVRTTEVVPEIVVLDLLMPRLDGLATLPRLRRLLPAAALFSSSLLCLLASPLAVRPALAHALVDVQADLQQREPAVAFEPDVVSPFPSFHLTDPDGKPVDLASLRGKVVVVEFISTECADGCGVQSDAQSKLMSQIQADVASGQMAD